MMDLRRAIAVKARFRGSTNSSKIKVAMVLTDVWKRLKAAFVSCSDGIAAVETVSLIIFY
jgi:hypothetical protein